MYPLFIVIFFGSLYAAYSAADIPKEQAFSIEAKANVEATNYIAYRKAVLRYLEANPSASGVISDVALAPYYLPGYIRNPNWTNLVSSGTVFVYATTEPSINVMSTVYKKSNESLLIGKKSASTGHLVSMTGIDTGVILPVSIPNNALVILGK